MLVPPLAVPAPSKDKDPDRRAVARARRHDAQVTAIARGIRSGNMPDLGPVPEHVPTTDDRRCDALTRLAIAPHVSTTAASNAIDTSTRTRSEFADATDIAHRVLVDTPDDVAALRAALKSMIASADVDARASFALSRVVLALVQERDALREVAALTSSGAAKAGKASAAARSASVAECTRRADERKKADADKERRRRLSAHARESMTPGAADWRRLGALLAPKLPSDRVPSLSELAEAITDVAAQRGNTVRINGHRKLRGHFQIGGSVVVFDAATVRERLAAQCNGAAQGARETRSKR